MVLTPSRVLDGRVRSLRDNLSKQWSELLYNGLYFSPERAFLQRQFNPRRGVASAPHEQFRTLYTDLSTASLDFSQQRVCSIRKPI